MPRSSRHKSHKQSKHNSKDYSDSEEDVKLKEKSGKDESTIRVYWESASGEKRKISPQANDGEDLSGQGNSELSEYASSKRRKEKADVTVGVDRWNGDGDVNNTRNSEKDRIKGESSRVDSRAKESSNKGESLRTESKNKRYESGGASERREDSLASVVVDKEEGKIRGESKTKSERDSSRRKEGKDSKEKDRRSEKEKNGGQDSKHSDSGIGVGGFDTGKKQGPQLDDFIEDRHGKRARKNTERASQDELQSPYLEKEIEKKLRRRRECSIERDKTYDDSHERDERRLSTRGDHARDLKPRDDKQKDRDYVDKYPEDLYRDEQRDEKYRVETDKYNKYRDGKYQDGKRDGRRRDNKLREDGERESRRRNEKYRKDGGRDGRLKDDKYWEGTERDGQDVEDKYHEDGDGDMGRKDERHCEDGEKVVKHERYYEDGDRDDGCMETSYREDDLHNRHQEEKYRDDCGRESQRKYSKQGDGFDKEKRGRGTKYRDERVSRDRSGDKSDAKHSRDDGYATERHSRKSSAYDDSPTHNDQTGRYRDGQGRRRASEKEDYADVGSKGTKDQRSDSEKKGASSLRIDPATDRGRSTSRHGDLEFTSSHGRRWSSPASSSYTSRDHYRVMAQDETRYRDYFYEERVLQKMAFMRDYAGGPEKTSSWSLEKLDQKDDGHVGELSAERHVELDTHSSPMQLVDKPPSSTADRRQFSRSDVRRSADVEESAQQSGSTRDGKEFSGNKCRGRDVLPGDEFSQADAETLSFSSPSMRNKHFSSSSRSWPAPPPPFRIGIDSPLTGSAEEDSRGHHRRIADPNMGRIQGNAWRGVPTWPSPVANGFMPFPHVPPPVGFNSVMQPFPAPPMFGGRPSMELNHPAPYHMPDANGFPGTGRPVGWRNQADDSCPPFVWDANNAVFGNECHIYGRPDWDHSRNQLHDQGCETSGDLWKSSNRTASLEIPSSEKGNNSTQSADGTLAGQPNWPAQFEQAVGDQLEEITNISQFSMTLERNEIEAGSLEETSDVANMSRNDDAPLHHVYLSRLDISADLSEPHLFNQCQTLIDVDQNLLSDVDDSTILCMEEALESKVAFPLSSALFASTDDSIFQKAMSLYKSRNEDFRAEDGEKLKVLSELTPNCDLEEDQDEEDDKTEKLLPTDDDLHGSDDASPHIDAQSDPLNSLLKTVGGTETLQLKIDTVANTTEKSVELIIPLHHVNIEEKPVLNLELKELVSGEETLSVEIAEASDDPSNCEGKAEPLESASTNDDVKSLDARCGRLLNSSDVLCEASDRIMPESVVSGSVNCNRIHHSSESTH